MSGQDSAAAVAVVAAILDVIGRANVVVAAAVVVFVETGRANVVVVGFAVEFVWKRM